MSEWGPWIEHDGLSHPSGIDGRFIGVEFRCGHTWHGIYGADAAKTNKGAPVTYGDGRRSSWVWGTYYPHWDALRYRIRKPRGLTILENLIADLPAPVGPKVTA